MRILNQLIDAQPAYDGDGVKIRRLAGRGLHRLMDPFLMVDEINSDEAADYIGGFPEHPHRGFETITYMKAGRMRHRDHLGNEGVIGAGDVQWMTAGAGVLHSEMPEQDQGLMHGFQIWLNLPAKEKMKPAAYRDIKSGDIPQCQLEGGGVVRVIAGSVVINEVAVEGRVKSISTTPVLIDLELAAGAAVNIKFCPSHTALVYVYQGATDSLKVGQLGEYSTGSLLHLMAASKGAKMLVLGGDPIKEPIAQYGPFVMNTAEEIEQAIADFQTNQFVSGLSQRS